MFERLKLGVTIHLTGREGLYTVHIMLCVFLGSEDRKPSLGRAFVDPVYLLQTL
jgi:hypothetical protein